MKILHCIILAALWIIVPHSMGGEEFLMPRGFASVRMGMGLKEFLTNHSDAETSAIFGTTNISRQKPDQKLAIVKTEYDPEYGALGDANDSICVKEYIFKGSKLAEVKASVLGDYKNILTIQKAIINDCFRKYGPNYTETIHEDSALKNKPIKMLGCAWKYKTHCIVVLCTSTSGDMKQKHAFVDIKCIDTNNVYSQKYLVEDRCRDDERQLLFKPLVDELENAKKESQILFKPASVIK